jgi:CheY-like chemotaxis protein
MKLYLPRHIGEDTGAPSPVQVEEAPRALDHEIILVVEDDERVRHVSIDYLRDLGYTVMGAADARQALALMELQEKVDLLFTDVVMPDMNGRELAEEVYRRWPETRVLFTTGYTRNAIVHNGVLDHGVNLLTKPFRREQLGRKVREALDAERTPRS